MCIYEYKYINIYVYIYIYIYIYGTARDCQRKWRCSYEGSALYDMFFARCICAVTAWWFDNPHQQVVSRNRIPRST